MSEKMKNNTNNDAKSSGQEPYYIGLDIGTNSVGWAVTDDKYNLCKVNGKSTWGVRLFEEAKTAEDRRLKRSLRRRLHRRRVRLNYLKELFRPAIEQIDKDFFKRLEKSYLYYDKDTKTGDENSKKGRGDFAKDNDIELYSKSHRFHLFEGKGITDAQYYRDFPTIYHLRHALITGSVRGEKVDEKGERLVDETQANDLPYNLYDPRLVFLALHSLLKARGSFLLNITEDELGEYIEGGSFKDNLKETAEHLNLKLVKPKKSKKDKDEELDNTDIDNLMKLFKNQYEVEEGQKTPKVNQEEAEKENRETSTDRDSETSFAGENDQQNIIEEQSNEAEEKSEDEEELAPTREKPKMVKVVKKEEKLSEFKKLVDVEDKDCNENFKKRKELFYTIISLAFGGLKTFKHKDDEFFNPPEDITICFSLEDYEGELDKLRNASDDNLNKGADAIESAHKLYLWSKVNDALHGKSDLCDGKIVEYDKHKKDLKDLKDIIKTLFANDDDKKNKKSEVMKIIFDKQKGLFNYEAYVHHREKYTKGESRLTKFRKVLNEKIGSKEEYKDYFNGKDRDGKWNGTEEVREKLNRINKEFSEGTFLPIQRTVVNADVPNALIKKEYREILNKAKESLRFLDEDDKSKFKDDASGKKPYDKIFSLVDFRIPYYVGPLAYDRDKSENKWVVRKEEYKNREITPWVFKDKIDDVIDKAATRKAFIGRMVSNCTYLSGEEVLPKNSIILQKQQCLEELNNLRIIVDGKCVPYESEEAIKIKQYLFKNVFEVGKSPTRKEIKDAIARYYKDAEKENVNRSQIEFAVGGEDKTKLKSSYSSYVSLKKFNKLTDDQKEKLIRLYTIFGSEADIAKEEANEIYKASKLDGDEIQAIHNILSKMKGWGRYSKALLTGKSETSGKEKMVLTVKYPGDATDKNINAWLWETNYNIQYLISMKKVKIDGQEKGVKENFEDRIREFNKNDDNKKSILNFKFSDIDLLCIPVAVKRSTWQSVRIVKELIKAKGYAPSKIFIETTRFDGEKGKTVNSRSEQLEGKYKAIKKGVENLQRELADNKGFLDNDRYYLYFMQMGKDMYTGEPINIKDLENSTTYDVDHIYPRSKTNDNSIIDNKVLVLKEKNGKKNDKTIQTIIKDGETKKKVTELWKLLCDKNLISKEKYRRLMYSLNHSELEDSELEDFKNAQLNVTSWATKSVMNVLKSCSFADKNSSPKETEPEIVSVKSNLASELRAKYRWYKRRDINDMHHAKDAYLNIVAGNVYNEAFTHQFKDKAYNLSSDIYDDNVYDVDNRIVWDKEKSRDILKKTMKKNDPLLTRMQTTKNGELFKATVCSNVKDPKSDKDRVIALKDRDLHYGYYNSLSISFFTLAKSKNGSKPQLSIECIPVWYYNKKKIYDLVGNKNKKEDLTNLIRDYLILSKSEGGLGMTDVEVIIPYIRINSLLKYKNEKDFFKGYVSGRSKEQLLFKIADMLDLGEMEEYAIKVCKFVQKCAEINNKIKDKESDAEKKKAEEINKYKDKAEMINEYKEKYEIKENDNKKLYNKLIEIHKGPKFIKRPASQLSLFEEKKDVFDKLSKEDQTFVLYQIILYLNGGTGDFSKICQKVKKMSAGRLRQSKNVEESLLLINQSVTGLYEKIIDLSDDNKANANKEGDDGQ